MARILIVDDSDVDAYRASRAIEKSGMEVVRCYDGVHAVDYIRNYTPDLVLLDIVMPIQDGFKTLRQLRSSLEFNSLPIVMLSSKSDKVDIEWASRNSATGYLTKPVDTNLLIETLRCHLGP